MSVLQAFGQTPTDRVQAACRALVQGQGIILIDDEDRENEGDLIFSAEHLRVADVATMIRDCSGIICLCLTSDKARQLSLRPMVEANTSPYQTAFTVSIEAKTGVTTGVSARDRWVTIQTAIRHEASGADLRQPGHVFPLIARDGGVQERRGHTEGSLALMKQAGLLPAAVLCELMNPDGTMKKQDELVAYAHAHRLTMVSIEDIMCSMNT